MATGSGNGSVTIRMDSGAISALLRSPDGDVVRGLTVRADNVQTRAKVKVGKKTRRLETSIVKRFEQDARGTTIWVGSEEPHAGLHHSGTLPHVIEGNPLLVFHWPKMGRVVYFRKVNHPGTKANPYLVDALKEEFATG